MEVLLRAPSETEFHSKMSLESGSLIIVKLMQKYNCMTVNWSAIREMDEELKILLSFPLKSKKMRMDYICYTQAFLDE